MTEAKYIPALRFDWLTRFYDWGISTTMPETKFKTALLNQADIQPFSHVLDFGVGTATLSLLARRMQPGAFVSGVDVDEKVLEIARRKIKRAGEKIDLYLYDGKTLPFARDIFDRVISSLVFHHLLPEQKLNCLKEIHRVLKPGGELHIADWGKPANALMRGAFYLVQFLDGFPNTADHVADKFPGFIAHAGFSDVKRGPCFNTIYGTLQLFSAIKK